MSTKWMDRGEVVEEETAEFYWVGSATGANLKLFVFQPRNELLSSWTPIAVSIDVKKFLFNKKS